MNLRVVQFIQLNENGEREFAGYQLEVEKGGRWEAVPVVEKMLDGRGVVVEKADG